MRDIRQDLRERIEAIAADRAVLQGRILSLDDREKSLKAELAEEEKRLRSVDSGAGELPFPGSEIPLVAGMGMSDLIKVTLRSKARRLGFDEIRDEIERTSFDFGEQKPGRVIQGGLMSLMRTGEVTKDANHRYGLLTNNKILPRETTH